MSVILIALLVVPRVKQLAEAKHLLKLVISDEYFIIYIVVLSETGKNNINSICDY
jgi:hypothetical protein